MDIIEKGPLVDEEGNDQQEQSLPQEEHSSSQGRVAFADELVEILSSETIGDVGGGDQTTTDDDERNDNAILRPQYSSSALSPAARKRLFITKFLPESGGQLPEVGRNVVDEPTSHGDVLSPPGRLIEENGVSETRLRGFLVKTKDIMSRRRTNVVHKQYCLQAIPTQKTFSEKLGNCLTCGVNLEKVTINFLHWIFRQNFPVVIMTAAAGFFFLTILFAIFIWIEALRHPECIGGAEGQSSVDYFSDAFILSWTTFSTVGYGLIYSGISADMGIDDIRRCTGITILVSLEAFVGVLFGGMCGAVLFIKVSRAQSFAQVVFGDIICVRYGTGVLVENENDENDGSLSTTEDCDFFPSPILEFRVANRLHSTQGGEIIDASVNVVASIDASQACHTLKYKASRMRRKKRGGRRVYRRRKEATTDDNSSQGSSTLLSPSLPIPPPPLLRSTKNISRASAYEEDPTGHFLPKRIMTKLECLTHDHPFFKRVFLLRHTLDHTSPLLTAVARQRVKNANGLWPKEMTDSETVRRSIQFDHLLVSLSGTSNADAKSVYAQTVYEFADVHVGYRFVNMLYRDVADGSLKVDTKLINDVMEQAGGGGEPLQSRNERDMINVPIL